MTLIGLTGVARDFPAEGDAHPVRALDGVSLRIHSGEFVWIAGSSGSGKSTLLNIIGCLDHPTEGSYRYAGTDLTNISADEAAAIRRTGFGFVSQSYDLIPSATVLENVELPAAYAGVRSSSRQQRAAGILDSFGMGERLRHRPAELSGGEQQRVAIARALMNGGRVILADEPTGALDARQGEEILALLASLARRGHTVIVASHDVAMRTHATRRIELRDGRVVAEAKSETPNTPPRWQPTEGVETTGRIAIGWLARTAAATLLRSPLRSMIGVLSIAVGIASVIAVLSLAEGAYQGSRQAIGQMGADKISISELRGEDGGSRLTNEDAEAIGKTVANVRDTVASLYRKATVQYGDQVVEASLYARSTASPPQFMYEEYSLESGAFLSERDDDDRTPVAVVGAGLRQQLFPTESNPVGRTLVIDGLPYEVKGVLAPHPIAEGPLYTRETATQLQTFLHVPYQTAITGLFPPGASPSIDVFVADPARAEETAADIRDLLIRRHGGNGFGLMVHQRLLGAYADLIEQNYLVLGGVGVIALVVGGAGIAATMLASVAQRRREIAIRMVVGARRKDIAGQFLAEAIGTAVAGALIGILAGFAVVPGVSAALGSPTATAPWFLPATVGLALVAGLASGILPALKAAQLEPRLALSAN